MATKREIIQAKAIETIKQHPEGIRHSQLVRALYSALPDMERNTIIGSVVDLPHSHPEITKPARGVFAFSPTGSPTPTPTAPATPTLSEALFYAPFAEYLQGDLDECTEAVELGGNIFGQRWGTPDVVGVYRPTTADLIKFAPEIVSAEIKVNPSDPITAFGQAVAYRLYSTKSFLVEPDTISQDDLERVEALCIHHGIGLILFSLDVENPEFRIRVRAQKVVPDMFWVNQFAEVLKQRRPSEFKLLFG